MRFLVRGLKDGDERTLSFDTSDSSVTDEDGARLAPLPGFEPPEPRPSVHGKRLSCLHVMLGPKCDQRCAYCTARSQKYHSASPKDVDPFVSRLRDAGISADSVQFWGGEPLVYWKTLERLVPALRVWGGPRMGISLITNGFLLTRERIGWMAANGVTAMGVSIQPHASFERGEINVLDVRLPEIRHARAVFGDRLSLFVTLVPGHTDFLETFREVEPLVGEGVGFYVLPLKQRGPGESRYSEADREALRRATFEYFNSRVPNHAGCMRGYLETLARRLLSGAGEESAAPHCRMPSDSVCVDLAGDVYACHTLALKEGRIEDIDGLRMSRHTDWKDRERCRACPFAGFCAGLCPSLGEGFEASCDNWRPMMFGIFQAAFAGLFGVLVKSVEPEGWDDRPAA